MLYEVITNDSVFIFLKDVLTEVMELFPSEYIHIGGDEAPKYRWENCPKCQKRMEEEGLANEHELQSWFITEIEKFRITSYNVCYTKLLRQVEKLRSLLLFLQQEHILLALQIVTP